MVKLSLRSYYYNIYLMEDITGHGNISSVAGLKLDSGRLSVSSYLKTIDINPEDIPEIEDVLLGLEDCEDLVYYIEEDC